MSKIGDFFKGLGRGVLKGLHLIAQLVTDEQVEAALTYVRQAAANQLWDNTRRREFAVSRTQALLHIPESLARLLVELAVQQLKHETDAGLAQIGNLLEDDKKEEADPPASDTPGKAVRKKAGRKK